MTTNTATDYGQPAWLPIPISPYHIAAILTGEEPERANRADHEPLDSGCYMPAVEYYTARVVMEEYGDEVLDYLQRVTGRVPSPQMSRYSWCQLPCFFLSRAVLAFAREHAALADWENESPINLTT